MIGVKVRTRCSRIDVHPGRRERHGRSTKTLSRQHTLAIQVIAMLRREGGTTLEEIMSAMGWQKHTTRALLSAGGSLAKNYGLVIASEKAGNQRRDSIKP